MDETEQDKPPPLPFPPPRSSGVAETDGAHAQMPPLLKFTAGEAHLKSFLVPHLLTAPEFDQAVTLARQQGVAVDSLLTRQGVIDEAQYLQALARDCDVALLGASEADDLLLSMDQAALLHNNGHSPYVVLTTDGVALVPCGLSPDEVRREVAALAAPPGAGVLEGHATSLDQMPARRVRLVSDRLVRQRFQQLHHERLMHQARDQLAGAIPEMSARSGISALQKLFTLLAILGIAAGFYKAPSEMAFALSCFFALFFFTVISLRGLAAFMQLTHFARPDDSAPHTDLPEASLPIYTLLVPLYGEAHMLPQLVKALSALDYPAAKLDIKLLLEARDQATITAARQMKLPGCFEILIVPDGQPLTKPKALNYGLAFARGEFVVIYDAEDIPHPGQLKAALKQFDSGGPKLATVQAKLNFYNPRQNWLTRQFTIEYSSLFDGLLPTYFHLGFPIPLGGTSNHFRRDILAEIGGWDPYNVTEDADLGIRLYRRGYYTRILNSTTAEEACHGPLTWLRQRTRWMKGWTQTYAVHMRRPFKLYGELGGWRFLGFQAVVGGPLISALVHPVFMVLLVMALIDLPLERIRSDLSLLMLWGVALFNLAGGYLTTMWLGIVSLRMRGFSGFLFAILTVPLYWLMISFAAYRALLQLLYAPFKWEKTPHKGL